MVREKASESLNFIERKLRQKIYDDSRAIQEDWFQGCLFYSLAFWDSDTGEIERACFDNSKIIRYFAEAAITIREKRDGLKKMSSVFQTTQNLAERVAAYLTLSEEAGNLHIDELYRCIYFPA